MKNLIKPRPLFHVGVFDSGVGGLTVLRVLQQALPFVQFTYLGDMARLPYGTKSADIIIQYSLKAAQFLHERGVDALVIACNTASSAAVPAIQAHFPHLPIVDVIQPTVDEAIEKSETDRFLVLATERTIASGVYTTLIQNQLPTAYVAGISAPLLVAMAEEGWSPTDVMEKILAHYISVQDKSSAQTVILGCTHFPCHREALEAFFAKKALIIDSAAPTARALTKKLNYYIHAQALQKESLNLLALPSPVRYLVTDSSDRFQRIAHHILGSPVSSEAIEFIHL